MIVFQVAVPFGVVTVSDPVLAFCGTVTVSLRVDPTLNLAGTPWNVTDVVPLKFLPRRMSVAPGRVLPGVTFAMDGTGAVIVWDEGSAEILRDDPDHLSFALDGEKLHGRFGLTRTGERSWILVKAADEHARPGCDVVAQRPASVRSGRTWHQVAADVQ